MISIYSDNHTARISTHILRGKMQFFTTLHQAIHTVLLSFRSLSPTNGIHGRKMAFIANHK